MIADHAAIQKSRLSNIEQMCDFVALGLSGEGSTANKLERHSLSDAAFETHAQELLRFHGKFHRQLAKYLLAEAIDDQTDGVLG